MRILRHLLSLLLGSASLRKGRYAGMTLGATSSVIQNRLFTIVRWISSVGMNLWLLSGSPLLTQAPQRVRLVWSKMRFVSAIIAIFLALTSISESATWYVDSSVSSSGNGTSWGTAWRSLSNISGIAAGDTVYISGGRSGSTQTYTLTSP